MLRLPYTGGRLECNTENNRIAVRYAAVDSAGTVLRRMTRVEILLVNAIEWIVVLRAFHSRSIEPVTELYAAHSRNREYGV